MSIHCEATYILHYTTKEQPMEVAFSDYTLAVQECELLKENPRVTKARVVETSSNLTCVAWQHEDINLLNTLQDCREAADKKQLILVSQLISIAIASYIGLHNQVPDDIANAHHVALLLDNQHSKGDNYRFAEGMLAATERLTERARDVFFNDVDDSGECLDSETAQVIMDAVDACRRAGNAVRQRQNQELNNNAGEGI